MLLKVCPPPLRKYGFCGVLALLYACKLPVPSSELAFNATLDDIAAILGDYKRKQWARMQQRGVHKKRGSITLPETLVVLSHHGARCSHRVQPAGARKARQSIKRWLATSAAANTSYIVHTNKHAVFVDVGRSKRGWRLYDQQGRRTREDLPALMKKGGILSKKVVNVIEIGPPARAAGGSDGDDDVPLQTLLKQRAAA